MKFIEISITNIRKVPSMYIDESFKEFSMRDWITWSVEIGVILVYEYENYIEDMRLIRGLIKV